MLDPAGVGVGRHHAVMPDQHVADQVGTPAAEVVVDGPHVMRGPGSDRQSREHQFRATRNRPRSPEYPAQIEHAISYRVGRSAVDSGRECLPAVHQVQRMPDEPGRGGRGCGTPARHRATDGLYCRSRQRRRPAAGHDHAGGCHGRSRNQCSRVHRSLQLLARLAPARTSDKLTPFLPGLGGGLIVAFMGGTIAEMSTALRDLLIRHVDAGTVPGAVALLGAGNAEVVTAGVASVGGDPMGEDAIMRIQSMTKAITSVAALRLVDAGRLGLDQNLADWLPELADPAVLRSPTAELDDTVPARRVITLRHLLTNTSGYGMVLQASPLQEAMAANGTEAGPEPPAMGADEWLRRLTDLPLAFQPGEGWRYHHSFGVLGILISRVTGRPLGEHLAEDVLGPLGMTDTAPWVAEGSLDRLPAAYRHGDEGLVETEPAGGGFYAGPPPFDVSHGELVSTAADYHRFARMLAEGGRVG